MTRLTHSVKGYYRSLQISRHSLFSYIEGISCDPFFYGEILDQTLKDSTFTFALCRAIELPGSTGGKKSLINFYSYLKSRNLLFNDFKGKKTVILFFLDKDIDELSCKTLRSRHVCYTEYYSVENYIFKHGNLSRGLALASSLEHSMVASNLGDQELWRNRVALCWSDWIKLCIFATKKDISCGCGMGIYSKINPSSVGPMSQELRQSYQDLAFAKSGLTHRQFKRSFQRVSKLVDGLLRDSKHDQIFNGKWYEYCLEEQLRHIAGGTPYRKKGIGSRLKSTILSTLDFSASWADHFAHRIKHVINMLDT